MSVGSTFPIHRKPACFIFKKLQSRHSDHVIHYNLLWFHCCSWPHECHRIHPYVFYLRQEFWGVQGNPADGKTLVVELECGQKELGACESPLYWLPFKVVASWRRRSVRGRYAQVCILPPRFHSLARISIWRHQSFPSSPLLRLADTTVPWFCICVCECLWMTIQLTPPLPPF